MTVGELQTALRERLGEGYVNDPRVTVEVLKYQPFYILEEVSRSGEFPFRDGLTVTQPVALAGDSIPIALSRSAFYLTIWANDRRGLRHQRRTPSLRRSWRYHQSRRAVLLITDTLQESSF
jgi:hypothetical protein